MRDLAQALGAVAGGDRSPEQLRRVVALTASSARAAGGRAVASGRWLADVTVEAGAHVPVRDVGMLQDHHRGATGTALAGALVRNASRASGAVGALAGGAAAVSQLHPATWAVLPAELLAETAAVVAIEMKLVGELHAVARRPIAGTSSERGVAIARSWLELRGIRPEELLGGGALGDVLGHGARRQLTVALRRRLLARTGRNLSSFIPFLAGAVAGGELNRRATREVGEQVAASLGLLLR